jgi:hypothetical protein
MHLLHLLHLLLANFLHIQWNKIRSNAILMSYISIYKTILIQTFMAFIFNSISCAVSRSKNTYRSPNIFEKHMRQLIQNICCSTGLVRILDSFIPRDMTISSFSAKKSKSAKVYDAFGRVLQ